MVAPTIPFTFEQPSPEDYLAHLVVSHHENEDEVSWPPAGVTFNVPKYAFYPSREAIEKANPGHVTFHGDTGYSVGTYHEFLVHIGEGAPLQGFRMGRIEVTIGQATPLMAYLFDGIHKGKYFGEWPTIETARIVGANGIEEAELAFGNALIRYHKRHSRLPRRWDMNLDFMPDEDNEEATVEPQLVLDGPVVRDLEPVRFFHEGLTQGDDASACLYFYRVLEFYAFSSMSAEFARVRRDTRVSDDSFPAEVLKLISRDEKGPLLRLVNQLAGKRIVKNASSAGLIDNESSSQLGDRLYAFRNSIVHGKSSYGYELHSSSLFEKQTSLPGAWRSTLRELARGAIERFGSKLL